MASIGSVVSTAVTGGKAPVFEGVAKEVHKAVKASSTKTDNKVESLETTVQELTVLVTKLLAEKGGEEVEVPDEVQEDTPKKAAPKADVTEETPKAPAKK